MRIFIKKKKGQSTVEYLILVTAVVAVIIFFVLGSSGTSVFKNTINAAYDQSTNSMVNMSQRLDSAFNTVAAPPAN